MTTSNINLTIDKKQQEKNAKYCKEKGVILPTFAQLRNPQTVPDKIKEELKGIGLWDLHPRNLFRITWKNEPKAKGGAFGGPNYIVFPPEITGVKANIVALTGKWFPTGAHKVGATYGCLIPPLITGQFDSQNYKAVWPSTGNYCRGGSYISNLMGVKSIAILPEGMSRERFDWLRQVAGEVIATPGTESNVKEIFDKCWELRKTRTDIHIFNQFEELGNPLWHYNVTGPAFEDILKKEMKSGDRFIGGIFSSGSAGTLGSGYYLKTRYPHAKVAAAEALQCPTLLNNGFGAHRIEGIGDKHIPWIHDIKNTDLVIAVDDEVTMRMLRLFNEKKGREYLQQKGVKSALLDRLDLVGISGLGNLTAAIKMAKYYELTEKDWLVTVCTDSMELYGSRLEELEKERGKYSEKNAYQDEEMVNSIGIDYMEELTYQSKKRIHHLKYYTWVEQQGRTLEELNNQWYGHEDYWQPTFQMAEKIDQMIIEFNQMVAKS
ncbi:MAG: pyridoxal-phosphate dependent enzyme [Pseudomonadota bacterium]